MKITRYFRQLVCSLALLSCASHAAQVAEPYTTYKRFDPAGRVVGTFTSDPDASGALGFQAVRNTYSSDRRLLTKVEKGELASFPDENYLPSAWGSFGFVVYSRQEFGYDDSGKKTSQRVYDKNNVLISLTEYSYDSVDRLICTAVRMDLLAKGDACASNNLTGANPDRITKLTYDGIGLVLFEERAVGTALQQKYSTNTYNGGLLASQTDANGNRTELYYDANGRLKRMIYPSPTTKGIANGTGTGTTGDFVEFTYDANGNKKTERKRNGALITYTYDANNRPIFKDLADNTKDVCFDYDLRGLQKQTHFSSNYTTTACTNSPGITNTFDGFGNLATATTNQLGVQRVLNYTYDFNNNRTSIKHPDGSIFSYFFDKTNRVLGVSDSATPNNNVLTVNYQANGRRQSITRNGNSATTTQYNFNNGFQLNSFVQNFPASTNALTNSFTYNAASQIQSLTKSNSIYYYTGSDDRNGAYVPDGLNRYKTVGASTLDYDLNSNLYRDGSQYYSYDDENRLVGASGPNSANIVYDPNGRLFQTTINGTSVQYLYDGDALVAEYNTSGTLLRRYIHGDQVDEPWVQYNGASLAASNRRYLHSDHQGSIIAHSDVNGNVLATLAYDTYGIPKAQNISVDGAFAYTGQIRLTGLGLYHYKARAYDPKLGRFLQTDPIGYKDNMDLYSYVGNDPLNNTDPSGNSLLEVGFLVADIAELGSAISSGSGLGMAIANVAIDAVGVASPIPGISEASHAIQAAAKVEKVASKAEQAAAKVSKVCCFVAGTLVQTTDGDKPIESIKLGDLVYSKNPDSGEKAVKPVTHLFKKLRPIYELKVASSSGVEKLIETTEDHPFYVTGKGWIHAARLVVDDVIESDKDGIVRVVSGKATTRITTTYNIEVADFHTYYATEFGLLVHNACTYQVPGSRTASGKPYIGMTSKENPAKRPGNGLDGRLRQAGDKTTEMGNASTKDLKIQEQTEMNAAGGIDKLDNKINSIKPDDWAKYGIPPPK